MHLHQDKDLEMMLTEPKEPRTARHDRGSIENAFEVVHEKGGNNLTACTNQLTPPLQPEGDDLAVNKWYQSER